MQQLERKPITILLAEDDPDDALMAREALVESRLGNHLEVVRDGEVLMDFLHARNEYADRPTADLPGLILLDLNMPRKDGREVLKEIKGDPRFRSIPVVILTTSQAEEDIFRSYDLGVNSFISKPVSFDGLVEVMRTLGRYWFEIVQLPQSMERKIDGRPATQHINN